MPEPLRLAMWSGPRNLSTALLRSFGSRADTAVVDEPLYAHYVEQVRPAHPGLDEVLARHERDWRKVAAFLTGPVPGGRAVFYQKHMAHHLLPDVGRDWLASLTHAFLIREPRAMLASLARVMPAVTLRDTGLLQQVELFEAERARLGRAPPVVDAGLLLQDPEGVLGRLCSALGLPFERAMLRWEPGPRETDGCWGPHWYANVWRSTGFGPPPRRAAPPPLPEALEALATTCERLHAVLAPHALGAAGP